MVYRKGERTRRHNEREYPYFADIPVPDWGGFGGGALRCITQWHTWNGVPEMPGNGSRKTTGIMPVGASLSELETRLKRKSRSWQRSERVRHVLHPGVHLGTDLSDVHADPTGPTVEHAT